MTTDRVTPPGPPEPQDRLAIIREQAVKARAEANHVMPPWWHLGDVECLLAELVRLTRENAGLREALDGIMLFRAHLFGCEVEQTDFCTCGMKQWADGARSALGSSTGGSPND